MIFVGGSIPRWVKQISAIGGVLLAGPGVFITAGFVCLGLMLFGIGGLAHMRFRLFGLAIILLTLGAGGAIFWQSLASLQNRPTTLFRLPSVGKLVGALMIYLISGNIIFQSDALAQLFLPPTLLLGLIVAPLVGVAWFTGNHAISVTRRQVIVTLAASAIASTILLTVLASFLTIAGATLSARPVEAMFNSLSWWGNLLDPDRAALVIRQNSWDIFLYLVIALPLFSLPVKLIITIPIFDLRSQRNIFVVGAVAGAAFAAVESTMFGGLISNLWGWLLVLQVIGGAIHPLSSGLFALAWYRFAKLKYNEWTLWLAVFGTSLVLHGFWNLGLLSLLVVQNESSHPVFPDSIFILFLSLVIICICSISGIGVFWVGQSIIRQLDVLGTGQVRPIHALKTEAAVAVWAFTSLLFILPVGIIGLRMYWI